MKESKPSLIEGLLIRAALAFEANLDRIARDQENPSPKGRTIPRRWLLRAGGVALSGAALAAYYTGKIALPEAKVQTTPKPRPIEKVGGIFPLEYGKSISRESYHFQNETRGLELEIDTYQLERIAADQGFGLTLPIDAMVGAIIVPYSKSVMDEAGYEKSFIGIVSKTHPNRKYTRAFTLEIYKVIAESFLQVTGPETLNYDLSVALSLKWAEQMRSHVDQVNPNIYTPGLREEAREVIKKNPPIKVTFVSRQAMREALNIFGPTTTTEKDGTQVLLNHVSYIKLDNGLVYSKVEGLDMVVYTDLMRKLDSKIATQIRLAEDEKLVTVLLPITNDPEEMEKARAEFEQKEIDSLMRNTWPDKTYKPVLNIIPIYNILWQAYETKKPDEKYDGIRYSYFVYGFIEAYYRGAGKTVSFDDFKDNKPFNPINIKPELVERALVAARVQKARTPVVPKEQSPNLSSLLESPLYENVLVVVGNELFYNSTSGALFVIFPETIKSMDMRQEMQKADPSKPQVFVFAPVRNDPTAIDVEKSTINAIWVPGWKEKYGFDEDPEVIIIPVLDILENSKKAGRNPTDATNFSDYSYYLSQHYMAGRNPNSANGIKMSGEMRPIKVISLDPFLINRALEAK